MKTLITGKDRYLLRFDRGEDVSVEFKKWADGIGMKDLKAAMFTMLGAAQKVTLAYYNLHEKKYYDKEITEDVEIITVAGNIAWKKDDAGNFGAIIHAHGTFGGPECQVWGGHVKSMIVSVTCEVSVIILDGEGEAVRELDESCGLALMR